MDYNKIKAIIRVKHYNKKKKKKIQLLFVAPPP